MQDIEIICVDDCSSDASPELLKKYADRDSRIRIITLETNRGVSAARNAGMRAAAGSYIGFVDSDDEVASDFFERLYPAEDIRPDIIKGTARIMPGSNDGQREFASYYGRFFDRVQETEACKGQFFYHFFSAIYRRDFLTSNSAGFNEDQRYGEDLCFAVRSVLLAEKIKTVPDAVYTHYDHEDSTTRNAGKNLFSYIHSLMLMTDRILEHINTIQPDEAVYAVIAGKLLLNVHFAADSLKQQYPGFDIFGQWGDYILEHCRYREQVYRNYQAELKEYNSIINRAYMDMLRKRHTGSMRKA